MKHKVCAIDTESGVGIDFSTLPLAYPKLTDFGLEGKVEIEFEIVHLFTPSKPGGYMIVYRKSDSEEDLLQTFQGLLVEDSTTFAVFFPLSQNPCHSLMWYPTRQEAEDEMYRLCELFNQELDVSAMSVVPFDHQIELGLYHLAKWLWVD